MALNLAESLEDFMWFQLLLEKLDPDTRKLFESDIRTLGPAEIPKFKQLADFIEGQCRVLDSLGKPREPANTTNSSRQVNTTSKAKSVFVVDSSPQNCALCTGKHVINKCPEFTPKTSRQRFEIIKSRRLCINCLRPAHNANACNSKSSCRVCQRGIIPCYISRNRPPVRPHRRRYRPRPVPPLPVHRRRRRRQLLTRH
jgi:hypothetical protein